MPTRDQAVRNPATQRHVHDWLRSRAMADAPMQAAARARDAAQGESRDPEDTDITSVLTGQHDQVTMLMKQLKTIPGVTKGGSDAQQSQRASIVDMIIVQLSQHEAAEEEHFWPWVQSVLDDGDELAGTAFEQEQQGKDLLAALGGARPSQERFDELAGELEKAARKHVAFEDRVLLRLREVTSPDDRAAVGERFLKAERRAPTRPHPRAPAHPKAAVQAAGAAGAAMDRVRDKAGGCLGRPDGPPGEATPDDESGDRVL